MVTDIRIGYYKDVMNVIGYIKSRSLITLLHSFPRDILYPNYFVMIDF